MTSCRLVRNRVLSIFPLKIGTPISTHLTMTSRRSRPDSRASSLGVRWIAIGPVPPLSALHILKYCALGRRAQSKFWLVAGLDERMVDGPAAIPAPMGYSDSRGVAQPGSAHRSGR